MLWNLGNISKQELVDKLSGLAHRIGVDEAVSIQSLDRILPMIKKYFEGKS